MADVSREGIGDSIVKLKMSIVKFTTKTHQAGMDSGL